MKLRHRRLFSPTMSQAAFKGLRLLRQGTPPSCDPRAEKFVLRQQKVLAAPIPKVASRTVQAMFAQASGNAPGHEFDSTPDEIAAGFPDYFVFSFVRNPWSRVHSCWKDKIADAVTASKLSILSRFEGIRPFMPFPEFVEWLDSDYGSDAVADRHWLSQTRHLSTSAGVQICDFVGKIESFDADLDRVESLTGVTFPRIAAQNVKPAAESYHTAFDERTRQIIGRRYGEDIEAFGYRFD
ncbi:sulfotransferase family 2 domain-containing protein [Ruegeria sp. HKCCA5426]|uniref:sulfotransferase family 2 domain-containing protein n=1 Tax=Ruegeria sp. HKCCA5426 TaxID=2682985 RepID=UPI0014896137|nr:sulfotransferase family 2 domain-containing protein [Ruegeria sp. HKCCA5426]